MTPARTPANAGWALVASSHPVPSVLVATLTTVFAWALGLEWWQVGLVFLAMLTNQLGIGLGNDWWDAEKDTAAGRADKPIATGALSAVVARNTAFGLGFAALAVSVLLGPWAAVCQAVMLFAGWWYNLHAKSHWSSPLSYLLGFGLLPIFPALALETPQFPVWWVVVVAGLLGIGAHFANALPDLLTDADTNVRGMPQRLGPHFSGLIVAVTVASASVIIAAVGTSLPVSLRVTTALTAVGAATVATVLSFRQSPPRIIFPLVMVSAAVCTIAIATHFVRS